MNESLFSDLWYRVADMRPRLKAEVQVQRQLTRKDRWFLLLNAANARHVRINQAAWEFIGRCNGERTVQAVWDHLLERFGDDAPTQNEVVHTLGELERQELLAYDTPVDTTSLVRRRDERAQQQKTERFVNPLALRVGLGDPSAWLARWTRAAAFVFNPLALCIWLLLVAAAALLVASEWRTLSVHAAGYMGTPRYLVLAWLVFPVLKAVHELAHALAVRRWGGEVHDFGFTLFVLVPAPYVDASAAAAFPWRYQRLIVAAAGMMAELAIAALACIVWTNAEPGLLRDLAFVTMFIAGVSSIVFNANPLLRFDAYYIACDVLDLPNLASRSRAWWRTAVVRKLAGSAAAPPMQAAAGERKWLVLYAPLSFAAQIAVSYVLVLWVGAYSAWLALLVGGVVATVVVVKPLLSRASGAWRAAGSIGGRGRAAVSAAGVGMFAAVAFCALPLPFYTVAGGVVWSPDHARVRPGTDGFISEFHARDGDWVRTGQLLVVLEDPSLLAQRVRLANRLEQLQANRFSGLLQSAEQARNAEEEIARVAAELRRTEQRIGELEVRAQTEGTLSMPFQRDLGDSFVRQGSTLAYIVQRADIQVRAAVPEKDAALVRETTRSVEVRLVGARASHAAEVLRDAPAVTFELPSPALGDRGGGLHPTDPEDKDGVRAREPVVLVDLKLPGVRSERIGATAWVRFDHGAQPLAQRWLRQLRQVFLQHLNPAG